MDTRVKERLIGAAVLVGIIVALVPEMLSGPRQDSPAPASGDQVRTYTIDLSRETGAGGPPREVLPSDAPVVTPAPAPEAGAPGEPAEQSAGTTSPGSAADAPSNEPSTPSRATSETPATAQAPPAGRATQTAAPSPASQSRGAAVLDSGWAVQLGSFASRDNADRLARELRQRGYRAFVSRFDSGKSVRHRVRVGPEQDRSRAEALAQRLRRDGQQVSIVEHP